jgi:zinc ribbon protein
MFCPSCGKVVAAGFAYCPECGAVLAGSTLPTAQAASPRPYSSPPPKTVRQSHFVIAVAVLTILLLLVAGSLALQVVQMQQQLAHPTLEMWNSCGGPCSMTAGRWREGGVPDTFDYYVSFNATVPVAVYFLTLRQYTQFASCGSVSCVTPPIQSIPASMSVSNYKFTLAEGCASYVAIYQSTQNGVISPDVSVTYNPASQATGVCA